MIVDFHTHTYHSFDSLMRPARILELARKRGLTGIVISDHNTIKGGLECRDVNREDGLEVIVAAEIATDLGDVTGLFLQHEIESRSFGEVIQEIKSQDGITLLNHPFVAHKLNEMNLDGIDLIEVWNSRVPEDLNRKAMELAKTEGKTAVAGSDAHLYSEIGLCRTVCEFDSGVTVSDLSWNRSPVHAVLASQLIKAGKRRDPALFLQWLKWSPKYLWKRASEKGATEA